ncbi:M48 family metallopeptidase [Natronobacterium gregoryi]|uniref:Protease n=3 Tax=Natronobacterium gregoryi TaxID=44930 RepID=L0AFJ6_NATGS|nr:M48 family metalloprotease [Natronobacterium gregoryi]AFZ72209.1 Zn-dependent protease with chaperone function [Natronobacterium gregoryi SP2]PLK20159.1 protease [Natronobacterium gregoryi SP2]SFJ28124.1 Heat shock protein. Metallo peptidase. MEROPS family M48B [Natronobacterium gregoryi]
MTDFGLKLRMFVVGSMLAALYLFVGAVGLAFLGTQGWPLVLLLLVSFPFAQYKFGTWMATRKAEEMPESGKYADIHRMTESLSRDMGIDKPKLMVQEMGVPNAFATGRKGNGVVVVSEELIRLLDRDELEGVVAHELAHIKNRDVLMMTVGSSIGMMVGYAVYFVYVFAGEDNPGGFIAGWILSMFAQMLVTVLVMAISRYREYVADDDARQYIGSGDPLARALEKISKGAENRESTIDDSQAALCIFNSERGLFESLFASHPPTEKRIEKLRR